MFNLGDRVRHLDTGKIGLVVGFGRCIIQNKCLAIIKVKLLNSSSSQQLIVKDPDFKWISLPENNRVFQSSSISRSLLLKPIKK